MRWFICWRWIDSGISAPWPEPASLRKLAFFYIRAASVAEVKIACTSCHFALLILLAALLIR
jgi:hypothetical protein